MISKNLKTDSFFEEKIIICFVDVETDPRPRYPFLDIPVWKGFAYFLKKFIPA